MSIYVFKVNNQYLILISTSIPISLKQIPILEGPHLHLMNFLPVHLHLNVQPNKNKSPEEFRYLAGIHTHILI